jgi:hypothetical protein
MPVERPDPGSTVPMPTRRILPPRGATHPGIVVPPEVGEMPVVRSSCWNPLDRPSGDADSVSIEAGPRQ